MSEIMSEVIFRKALEEVLERDFGVEVYKGLSFHNPHMDLNPIKK